MDRGEKHVAAEQGVAHGDSGEGVIRALVAVSDEAAAALVPDHPEARSGEEREVEVGNLREGAGGGGGGVGRLGGVEPEERAGAEDRRRVERVQAAEEGVAGDDAAERGARRAGTAEVGEGGEADQDIGEDVVGEGQLSRRRRRRHRECGADCQRDAARGGVGIRVFARRELECGGIWGFFARNDAVSSALEERGDWGVPEVAAAAHPRVQRRRGSYTSGKR